MYNKRAGRVDLGKYKKPNPYKQDIIVDPMGQWKYPGQPTRIPGNEITMQGVPYPVLGIDNLGNQQMMYPDQNYTFPGQYVDEYPIAKKGGILPKLPNKKSSKRYSKNILAKNKLFAQNQLTEKYRSPKGKIFDPSAKYFQVGGIPEDYELFNRFAQTLPSNLQDPNYEYGNPDQYDLYGMWSTVGKPGSFSDVQDGEYFPLQDDGTYHGFTVGSDGEFLKPMSHSTTWKEVMNSQLNTAPYFRENMLIQNEQGRLQYVPRQQEGGISPLEGNYISNVIMNRNRGTDFVDRAYALGANPGTPLFNLPDDEEFGSYMSHKMATGEDDSGQAWMFPTVLNPNNEAIKVPNQYAEYISSEGYKRATGMKKEGGFHTDLNKHRKFLRDWTYGQSIGMLQKQAGGDISIPELTKAQDGHITVSPFSYHGDTPGLYRFDTQNPTFNVGYTQPFGSRAVNRLGVDAMSAGLTAKLPYMNNTGMGIQGNLHTDFDEWQSFPATVETDLSLGYDPKLGFHSGLTASPQFSFGNVQQTVARKYGTGLKAGQFIGSVGPFAGASVVPGRKAVQERFSIPAGVKGNIDFGIGRKGIKAGLSGYAGADLMGTGLESKSSESGLQPKFNYGIQANLKLPIKSTKEYLKDLLTQKQTQDRDYTPKIQYGGIPRAQVGLDNGVVKSKTQWAGAPKVTGDPNTAPIIYEGKDVTVKAKGPEWAGFQREYQSANPWERYLAGEKNKYIRKNKGLNKAAGVTASSFPKSAEDRIRAEYDRKMNTYITRRLGHQFGFNPRERGEWIDLLTEPEKKIVAGSKYASKLQPSIWSRTMSGAQESLNTIATVNPAAMAYNALTGKKAPRISNQKIPGYTEREMQEAKENPFEAAEVLSIMDLPAAYIANRAKNANVENPSFLSGEIMPNVTAGDLFISNPFFAADLAALPKGLVTLGKTAARSAKTLGKGVKTLGTGISKTADNLLPSRIGNQRAFTVQGDIGKGIGTNLTTSDVQRTIDDQLKWITSEEYFKRRSANTGETYDKILADVNKTIKNAQDAKINVNAELPGNMGGRQTPRSLNTLWGPPTVEVSKTTANPPMVLKHEVGHLYSPAGFDVSTSKLHRGFDNPNVASLPANKRGVYANYPKIGTDDTDEYLQLGYEQQVRHLNARDQILSKYNLDKEAPLTEDQVHDFVTNWNKKIQNREAGFSDAESNFHFGKEEDYDDIWLNERNQIKQQLKDKYDLNDPQKISQLSREEKNRLTEETNRLLSKKITDVLNKAWATVPVGIGTGIMAGEENSSKSINQAPGGQFQFGGESEYEDLELTPEEIDWYLTNGYDLEMLPDDYELPVSQLGSEFKNKRFIGQEQPTVTKPVTKEKVLPNKNKTPFADKVFNNTPDQMSEYAQNLLRSRGEYTPKPIIKTPVKQSGLTPYAKSLILGRDKNEIAQTQDIPNATGYFAASPYAYKSLSGYIKENPIEERPTKPLSSIKPDYTASDKKLTNKKTSLKQTGEEEKYELDVKAINPNIKKGQSVLDKTDKEIQNIYYKLTNPKLSIAERASARKQYNQLVGKRTELIKSINAIKRDEAGWFDAEMNESPTIGKPLQKWGWSDQPSYMSYDLPKFETYTDKVKKEGEAFKQSKRFEELNPGKSDFTRWKFRAAASNDDPIKVALYGTRGERENQNIDIDSPGAIMHFLDQSPKSGWVSKETKNFYKSLKDDDYVGYLKANDDGTHSVQYLPRKQFTENNLYKNTFLVRQIKFDDIDFNSKVKDDNFAGHTYPTIKGTKQVALPISSDPDENVYDYSSGQSVVFIFKYKGKTRYQHFAGSRNDIKKEGNELKKMYNLKEGALTLGLADAGSYSSAVNGRITNDKLNSKDYGYYNPNSGTGAGMAIIVND